MIECVQAFNFEKDDKLLFVALNVHVKTVFECVQTFNLVEIAESRGIEHLGSKSENWMSNGRELKQYKRENLIVERGRDEPERAIAKKKQYEKDNSSVKRGRNELERKIVEEERYAKENSIVKRGRDEAESTLVETGQKRIFCPVDIDRKEENSKILKDLQKWEC